MIRVLKLLFTGDWHLHKWEDVSNNRVIDEDGNKIGTKFVVRCQHCGKITAFHV